MPSAQETSQCERWGAILMGIAGLATAWSAYQANLWGSSQVTKLSEAQELRTLLSQEALAASQLRTSDGMLSISIASALVEGRQKTIDFFIPRVRDDLRIPLEKWLASDPLHSKSAPAHPLLMPEYIERVVKPSLDSQNGLQQKYDQKNLAADKDGSVSDRYVLITVVFATVLFFCGVSSTVRSIAIEKALLGISATLLVLALLRFAVLPVAIGW